MGANEKVANETRTRERQVTTTEYINVMYDLLVGLGYRYNELYDMTLVELEKTIKNRRMEIGREIYRIATLVSSPLVKNFPTSPEEACPEFFEQKKGIEMPDFLKEKAMKRGIQ